MGANALIQVNRLFTSQGCHCCGDGPHSRSVARTMDRNAQGREGAHGDIADFSKGMLGANGIVGGGPPLACGMALSAKLRKTWIAIAGPR